MNQVNPVRVAAIDCGTNSVRLLIADVNPRTGEMVDIERTMTIVRLGEGVDRTGRFSEAALARTFAALTQYAQSIQRSGANSVRMVATSATRDASNRDVFIAAVKQILGVEPEVISGTEEAQLSFAGATMTLPGSGTAEPMLVVDIGGGSTEFVLGGVAENRSAVIASRSVDIGCVRLTERHFDDDPPTPDQVQAALADIDAAIDQAAQSVPLTSARTLIGLAGSVTTVSALNLGLAAYDPSVLHHSVLTASEVNSVSDWLLNATRDERAESPVMHPGRVDVIAAGALILRRIVAQTNVPSVLVSERDILDGIALSLT